MTRKNEKKTTTQRSALRQARRGNFAGAFRLLAEAIERERRFQARQSKRRRKAR